MAAIFLEGFDKYGGVNSNNANVQAMLQAGEWTTAAASIWSVVAGLSVTGQAIAGAPTTTNPLVKTLSASYARLIGGVRFASTLTGAAVVGVSFGDAGSFQATIAINPAGTIALRNGSGTGTILATSSATVAANSTHYLEWDLTFSNTGAYQLWLDGVSLFSGTGDLTTTANNSANQIFVTSAAGNTQTLTLDDLYLFDGTGTTNNAVLLTSPRVETTFPTSDSAVQFGFGAGILGSNAQRISTTNQPAANTLTLRRFTPGVNCTLASISVIPATSSGAINLRPTVYADSSGAAAALLSTGSTVIGAVSGTVITMPLTTPQSLTAGTQYWLGFMSDVAGVNFQQTDGNLVAYRANATFASGAPGTAPAMTGGQQSFTIWGNLTGVTGNWNQSAQQPPPGGLSYVFDPTVNHEDLYNFGALSVTPSNIYAVAVKGYLQRSDSGARTASLRAKSGASDGGGSITGITPATTFGWVGSMFETDPQTGAAWTGSGLNAAQSGVKVDS